MARVTMAFVEAGANRYPAAGSDTRSAVDMQAERADALSARSRRMSAPSYIAVEAARAVAAVAAEIATPGARRVATEAAALVHDPAALGARLAAAVAEADTEQLAALADGGAALPRGAADDVLAPGPGAQSAGADGVRARHRHGGAGPPLGGRDYTDRQAAAARRRR